MVGVVKCDIFTKGGGVIMMVVVEVVVIEGEEMVGLGGEGGWG